jgi:hypothetical protein
MWIETEVSGFLNLDSVELVFREGDALIAQLRSGAELTITKTDVDEAIGLLRRHLVPRGGETEQIPSASFRPTT